MPKRSAIDVAAVQRMRALVPLLQSAAFERLLAEYERIHTMRPASEWHEDYGDVLWHHPPICEPPYLGSPLCSTWEQGVLMDGRTFEQYYTHWSPLPDCNLLQDLFDAASSSRRRAG